MQTQGGLFNCAPGSRPLRIVEELEASPPAPLRNTSAGCQKMMHGRKKSKPYATPSS